MTSDSTNGTDAPIDRTALEPLRAGLELLALRAFGDHIVAEEIAQEALTRAVFAADRGVRIKPGHLAAFVAGIARHVIVDRRRMMGREVPLAAAGDATVQGDDALTRILSDDERRRVHAAFGHLSSTDAELLRLCYIEGLEPMQIAAQLGLASEVVRKRKSRALERLRTLLIESDGHARPQAATIKVPPIFSPTEDAL